MRRLHLLLFALLSFFTILLFLLSQNFYLPASLFSSSSFSHFVSMGQQNTLACSFDPQFKVERFSFKLCSTSFFRRLPVIIAFLCIDKHDFNIAIASFKVHVMFYEKGNNFLLFLPAPAG